MYDQWFMSPFFGGIAEWLFHQELCQWFHQAGMKVLCKIQSCELTGNYVSIHLKKIDLLPLLY
ncbi:MAG: hypothetical protein A3J49_02785 [Gallionellales bacterium RIFCSPHIGHO2_02_FULL_57_16]|nr:MAG: hypothetical protein A3J49_02785 [Gallionellales bacterium RIFCSPHIGHO2_02_FULL_57_16]